MLNVSSIKDKNECCGCSLCESVCPTRAIVMSFSNGLLLPNIDNSKCTKCGICYKNCEKARKEVFLCETTNIYIGKSKSKFCLDSSSSGGIFYEIASKFIKENGVVYSTISENGFSCTTIRCADSETLISTLKSKYIQSYQGEAFVNIANDLKEGKMVLICSTPCYLNAIKNYLQFKKVSDSNLFCIDFLCSGFINRDLVLKCKDAIASYTKSDLKSIVYRDKHRIGWGNYKFIFESDKGFVLDSSLYDFFALHYATSQNCLNCLFAKKERVGDITLGDAWGRNKYVGYVEDKLGTSVVYLNNLKGKRLLKDINCDFVEQDLNNCYLEPRYITNANEPNDYARFYNDFNKLNYIDLMFKYTYDNSVASQIKKCLYKIKIKKLWKTTK